MVVMVDTTSDGDVDTVNFPEQHNCVAKVTNDEGEIRLGTTKDLGRSH